MHGEDYICLGFLFGDKSRVAYISDVSRFPASTEYGKCWIIWKERNLRFFEVQRDRMFGSLFYWMSLVGCRPSNLCDFLDAL